MGAKNETVLLQKEIIKEYDDFQKRLKILKEKDEKTYWKHYDKNNAYLLRLDGRISSLEKLKDIAGKFSKINLNDYRYKNGTFSVYKAERLLSTSGASAYTVTSGKAHHEGVAIGNERIMLYSDYGVEERGLNIRFWTGEEHKDNWERINRVGISTAPNEYIVRIFFGEFCKEWVSPQEYNPLNHNCQHYVQEKISLLLNYI